MGGGGSTTSTSYTSSLPEWAQPYYEGMMDRAQIESTQNYMPYAGDRVAGTSGMQADAYNQVGALGEPAQLGQATDMTGAAADAAFNNTGNFQSRDIYSTYNPGEFGAAEAAKYMNPYQQAVTDTAIRKLDTQYQTQQQARNANAAKLGAFGGSRQGLVENAAMTDYNMGVADTQYKGAYDSFSNAQQQYERDRAAMSDASKQRLAADTSNQNAAAQAAQIRNAGYTTALQGANQLGALGQTQQELALNRANTMNTMGQQQQTQEQKLLDQQYADFANLRDYERNNLTFLSGILRGTNGVLGQDTISSAPSPSIASQLGGLGIAGAGLYGMANK